MHKLPNCTMLNYDLTREQIQQIHDYYTCPMAAWLIILITVLGTLNIITGILIFLRHTSNQSKISAILPYSGTRISKGD